MSMEHKAFSFRFSEFRLDLLPLLGVALASRTPQALAAFIKADLASFRDPYEGEPLDRHWEDYFRIKDEHQYGDFALTRYYDPSDDVGLGYDWQEIQLVLERELGTSHAVLGQPIGPADNLFDPGKMGSYFQSEQDVRRNLVQVERLESRPILTPLVAMLRKANGEDAGLYVTF